MSTAPYVIWDAAAHTLIVTIVEFGNGWAVLLPDGRYKLVGDAEGRLWWVMKLCRFEPGHIDGFETSIRLLGPEAPLPGLVGLAYHRGQVRDEAQ